MEGHSASSFCEVHLLEKGMLNQNVCHPCNLKEKKKQKKKCHREVLILSPPAAHTATWLVELTLIKLLSDLQTCKQEDIQFETSILSQTNKKQRKDEGLRNDTDSEGNSQSKRVPLKMHLLVSSYSA